MITSKGNAQIKNIKKLMESAKARKEQGLFVIEGLRLVSEAKPEFTEAVYVSEDFEGPDGGSLNLDGLFESVSAEKVSADVFRSISDTVSPQGILAVVRQPRLGLDEVISSGAGLFVILDDVRDPGNLGTIVRTAEACGAAVIMSPGCADIFNPKVIRATMGSIFRVPFAVSDTASAVKALQAAGVTVCAAALEGSVPYTDVNSEKVAFIIGNEANGVSREAIEAADLCVRIPMKGRVESLNAAVSAAVLMYHCF